MDLFFECVKPKSAVKTMSVDEAIDFLFCTPMLLAELELYVNEKVIVRIECDSRGAATYKFKTITGPHIVAEAFYRPVRSQLDGRCDFEGPPATPLSHYVPPKDKIRIAVHVLNNVAM
jgi:hypothetical protein